MPRGILAHIVVCEPVPVNVCVCWCVGFIFAWNKSQVVSTCFIMLVPKSNVYDGGTYVVVQFDIWRLRREHAKTGRTKINRFRCVRIFEMSHSFFALVRQFCFFRSHFANAFDFCSTSTSNACITSIVTLDYVCVRDSFHTRPTPTPTHTRRHAHTHTIAANRLLLHVRQIFSCWHSNHHCIDFFFLRIRYMFCQFSAPILFFFIISFLIFYSHIVFMVSWISPVSPVCMCVSEWVWCEWERLCGWLWLCPSIARMPFEFRYLALQTLTALAICESWTCHCEFIQPQMRHIAFFFDSLPIVAALCAVRSHSTNNHRKRKIYIFACIRIFD